MPRERSYSVDDPRQKKYIKSISNRRPLEEDSEEQAPAERSRSLSVHRTAEELNQDRLVHPELEQAVRESVLRRAMPSNLPRTSEKNTAKDLLNEKGIVKQRRYYDANGRAEWDIDYSHVDDGTHRFPHFHRWVWPSATKSIREDSRKKRKSKK